MSLQDIVKAQNEVQREQQAIREEVQALSRRVDQSLKGEIQRLASRLDAHEDKIHRFSGTFDVSGSTEYAAPPMARGGGRAPPGGHSHGVVHPANYGGRPASSAGGHHPQHSTFRSTPPASPNKEGYGSPGQSLRSPPRRKREDELQSIKGSLANVVQRVPKTGTWEEPVEYKEAPSSIDRFEAQLKNAIERSKEYQKYANNPIQAIQMLFKRMDKNHSGKVDQHELMQLSKLLEFQADGKALSALFSRYDVDHNGTLTIEEFSRSMFKLDGDVEFKAKSAIARMREVLACRAGGMESCKAMGSQFRIIDRDHTNQLTKDEFNIALDTLFTAYNCKFTPAERNSLFTMFDIDKSGNVNYDEFTRGIRGEMNDFRRNFVQQAFGILDQDGSGIVDTRDISRNYDVSQNPAVMSGKVSPQDAVKQFLQHYDGNHDGKVTVDEFIESYQWVSASIESDDYFELMIRNAWHITGGEGWCQNTSDLRVLVKHGNGPDEVVEVQHDLGLPRDPAKKYQEVVRRLTAQGVKDIQKVEFFG